MAKTVKPPTTPKSDAPGKKIPESQKKLDARDEKEPKSPEKEKGSEPDVSEKSSEKETGGETAESSEEGETEEGEDDEAKDEDGDEEEEDEEEIEIAKSLRTGSNLLSPEGVIFLPIALLIDLIGIVLIFFALDDFFILDIIGIATIGAWVFYKTGFKPPMPESTGKKAEDIAKKAGQAAEKAEKIVAKAGKYGKWLRPALCCFGEIIPYLGVIPFWTFLVWKTLMDS